MGIQEGQVQPPGRQQLHSGRAQSCSRGGGKTQSCVAPCPPRRHSLSTKSLHSSLSSMVCWVTSGSNTCSLFSSSKCSPASPRMSLAHPPVRQPAPCLAASATAVATGPTYLPAFWLWSLVFWAPFFPLCWPMTVF